MVVQIVNRLMQDRLAVLCAIFLLIVIVVGIFAPVIAPNDPIEINVSNKFAPMSLEYPFGTDHLGRCVFSRLIYGIRTTVLISIFTMFVTIFLGTILGLISGFFRGKTDEFIMRICDVFLSIPSEVMILAIVGMMGTGIVNIVVATVLAKCAWYTRMIRTIVIQYTNKGFIQFAKVSGFSSAHIIRRHILPQALGEIMVLATLNTGAVILMISALSFLGLGVQVPTPEWGMMLNEARNIMTVAPEQMIAPGVAILLVVAAFHFLGDSLQSAFNSKIKNKKG